jgi:tRNA threonylcarbamoyladenosine biosynthesis protein TsaB
MSELNGKLVLGLETGIDGGSLAILENGKLVDLASGTDKISKSEDLLLLLEALLKKNCLTKRDIGLLAISDAPGSITGIRIGLAIGKGLGNALSVPWRKISILDAMASISGLEGHVISALSTKKKGIYYSEYFIRDGVHQKKHNMINQTEFFEFTGKLKNLESTNVFVIANEELKSDLQKYFAKEDFGEQRRIHSTNSNLAEILGRAATIGMGLIT